VALGALASGGIELAQLTLIPGRDSSIGDLIFNTAGTLAGGSLACAVPILAGLQDRAASRMSVLAGLAFAGAVAMTGWLLQPSLPVTQYWGQWTPSLGHLEWYRGRVRSVHLGGLEVRPRPIEDSDWARSALRRGDLLDVHALAGPPVPGLASLFSIADDHERVIALVGPDRHALVYRLRTRAADFRLDEPDLRVDDAWPDAPPGTAIHVRVWSPSPGRWSLEADGRAHAVGFTAGTGWGFLYYPEWFPDLLRRLMSAAWVGFLAVPVGVFLRRRADSAIGIALVGAGLGILPLAVGLLPTTVLEWSGGVTGLVAGGMFARAVRATRLPRSG
jgi:hypothetical protein